MRDSFGRVIDYARISVTDRCNLRCVYCLPEDGGESRMVTPPFETVMRVGRVLASLGVRKFKITGGEPTLRPDIVDIVRNLKGLPGVTDVTLTTNGMTLAALAPDLAAAGLDSVNISLDSLNPDVYRSLTRNGTLLGALEGLAAATRAPIGSVKVNCVPQADTRPSDLLSLVALARDYPVHVRLIELMPIGAGAGHKGLSPETAWTWIETAYGPLVPASLPKGNGPATYYRLKGFRGLLGFISALQGCFCERCNRLRITADGHVKTCLHLDPGRPLPLDDEKALAETILTAVREKPARHLFLDPELAGEAGGRSMRRIGG
jgi:cyclic pyranopterin phosphate synthase